jgi:hypothetical protein
MCEDSNPGVLPGFGRFDNLGGSDLLLERFGAHTRVSKWSASSKSLSSTETCFSSALRFIYLPKCRCTLCILADDC